MAPEPTERFDVVVVGAGIAGASAAAELAADARVLLIERESQPGYHTTGRSAALFIETYGPPPIRALSRASAPFLRNPPAGFAADAILSPRDVLTVGSVDQRERVEAEFLELSARSALRRVSQTEALAMVPLLRPESAAAAFLEEGSADIDVHALHHGYLRRLRASGGRIETDCEVLSLERDGGGWLLGTKKGAFAAGVVVNAAGAWADELGALAGALRIGLKPKRRTAMVVAAPDGVDVGRWPAVVDVDERFYLKPDAGRLLISPADETPSPPCDAQPDELDVAICIDRIETAFDIKVARIDNRWAGLRSFVADKCPVVGFDPGPANFFWLAGQGGYGIQTSPAMARTAAALVLGRGLPADIEDQGVEAAALAPRRFYNPETASA